jgi:C-methyltransferase C-terminal domain/Putative zinc binding domain/Methyltransferase domain
VQVVEIEQPERAATTVACRFCGAPLTRTVVDLGMSPLCESFLRADQLDAMEPFYPLHVRVCESCHLVQLPEYVAPENIFTEYAYFSSYSDAFVSHARDYVEMITGRLGLSAESFVVELASNDGYLLQHFVERGIPVLGIDPARNVAEAAIARGIPTRVAFFGRETAGAVVAEHGHADLIVGNNVLSQVPNLDDFVGGIATLLAPDGVVTVEFPHLMRLLEGNLFDTIYHEHFSYFSLLTATRVFAAHDLDVFDLEEVWTHGGSLRLFVGHPSAGRETSARVRDFAERERAFGLEDGAPYEDFRERVERTKRDLLELLIAARRDGSKVAGYGAPGKGNTLLNYCGIRADLVEYTVDRNPHKHGLFLPGTHIPIFPPDRIAETRPDLVLVLPWNLRDEIVEQLAYTRDWGARLVFALPSLEVVGDGC